MEWIQEFNSSFWLSITGLVLGSVGACFAYCYKSKCTHIKLCGGLIDVIRNIDAELEDAESGINVPNNPTATTVVEEPQRRASIKKSIPIQEAINEALKRTLTLDERLNKTVIEELNRKDSFISNSI